jgi:hypothetical protein
MQACHATRLTVLLVLFYSGSVLLAAQDSAPNQKPHEKPYALIFGTVWGPDDHPVYDVKIKIHRAEAKKPRWELYSNHSGEFAQRVPAGKADYTIEADIKGVESSDGKPLHAEVVTVHVDNDERVDTSVHLK